MERHQLIVSGVTDLQTARLFASYEADMIVFDQKKETEEKPHLLQLSEIIKWIEIPSIGVEISMPFSEETEVMLAIVKPNFLLTAFTPYIPANTAGVDIGYRLLSADIEVFVATLFTPSFILLEHTNLELTQHSVKAIQSSFPKVAIFLDLSTAAEADSVLLNQIDGIHLHASKTGELPPAFEDLMSKMRP